VPTTSLSIPNEFEVADACTQAILNAGHKRDTPLLICTCGNVFESVAKTLRHIAQCKDQDARRRTQQGQTTRPRQTTFERWIVDDDVRFDSAQSPFVDGQFAPQSVYDATLSVPCEATGVVASPEFDGLQAMSDQKIGEGADCDNPVQPTAACTSAIGPTEKVANFGTQPWQTPSVRTSSKGSSEREQQVLPFSAHAMNPTIQHDLSSCLEKVIAPGDVLVVS
jgi:hypothetical protein